MFRKSITNKVTAFALSFAVVVFFSNIASVDEIIFLPEKNIAEELPDNGFLKLAQAQETASEKAARKKEARKLARERIKAERVRKRKERAKNRPKFGSFS